jgi:hypothetical protein
VFRGKPAGDKTGAEIRPLHTAVVATLRPSFRWAGVKDAEYYRFRLLSGEEGGFHEEWTARTDKPSLEFPEKDEKGRKVEALTHGVTRNWEVSVKRKGKDGLEPLVVSTWFAVLEERPAKEVAGLKELTGSKDPADWMLAAAAYQALDMHGEALDQFMKVDKARPGRERVLRSLVYFHGLARDSVRADEARERLKKLGVELKD